MAQIQMLNCGIPVVDRYMKGYNLDTHVKDCKYPIILYKNLRLRVGVEWPYAGQGFVHGQILDEDGLTALVFHGLDERGAFEDRRWVEASRNLPVNDLVREVEREVPVDVLIGCNFTPEDVGRADLIYIVHNLLGGVELGKLMDGEKLDIGIFPSFKGCGYFSIRGVKYSIPRLGEDTKILE